MPWQRRARSGGQRSVCRTNFSRRSKTRSARPGPLPTAWCRFPAAHFPWARRPTLDTHDAVGMQQTTDSRPNPPRRCRRLLDGRDRGDRTNSSPCSSGAPATSPSPSGRRARKTFPAHRPKRWSPAPWCFLLPAIPCRSTNAYRWWADVNGASWRHPLGPAARLTARNAFPSSMSPTPMRSPTRRGPANVCRPKRNGSLLRGVGCRKALSLGRWNPSGRPARCQQPPGAFSRPPTRVPTSSRGLRRSRGFRPTPTASTTWPGTSWRG